MLAALLLAAVSCIPLPTCTSPVTVSPCATPTAVIAWDRTLDTPTSIVAGYKLYYRYPGGTFQLAVDLPCVLADDGITKICQGVDLGYPVQRATADELTEVEYAVKAYSITGMVSGAYSNVVSICLSAICRAPGPCS